MMVRSFGSWKGSLLFRASLGGLAFLFACSSEDAPAPYDDPGEAGAPTPDGAPADGDVQDGGWTEPPPYDFGVACTVAPCVTQLAARGGAHACAILSNGTARCWGSNATGQLGLGGVDGGETSGYAATPRAVLGVTSAAEIATTGEGLDGTSCVVLVNHDVRCFGSDAWGQIGGSQRSTTPVLLPAPIDGLQAKSITLGSTFAMAIGTDDRLLAWGANDAHQLARTANEPDATASVARADRITDAVRRCAGTSTTGFCVTQSGELLSWGGGSDEQLGRTTSLHRDPIPAAIAVADVGSVATGAAHACALSHGRVSCWGKNDQGQLGTGRKANERLPASALLPAGAYAVAVFAGGSNTCAIVATGDLYCWGANAGAPLGASTPFGQALPTKVEGLGGSVVQVGVMDEAACALLRSGAVACWGDNLVGELGRGNRDTEKHITPEPVVFKPDGAP